MHLSAGQLRLSKRNHRWKRLLFLTIAMNCYFGYLCWLALTVNETDWETTNPTKIPFLKLMICSWQECFFPSLQLRLTTSHDVNEAHRWLTDGQLDSSSREYRVEIYSFA